MPILENVLIKTEEGGLKLMTTNLEMAISCTIRSKIENKGDFTVPSKLFSDYVSLLPKERVDIEQIDNVFTVSCETYQTRLNGIVAAEFPLIPTVISEQKFLVKVNDLRKAINQVIFSVAANESRPEISGVLFKFQPQGNNLSLILAATDSYRLAEKTLSVQVSGDNSLEEQISVIVPARAVSELVRILGIFRDVVDLPENLEIIVADNQVLFRYSDVELVSRTIEGKYPDYRQLIPGSFQTEVEVLKEDLIRAVKATSLFSRVGLNDINLIFLPDKTVKITATNPQTGEHSAEVISKINGKENKITVNYRYLIDGINNIESNEVKINLIDGISPCVLRSVNEKPDYLYIVMPIRQ